MSRISWLSARSDQLSSLVPGQRYALTLQVMLRRAKKRRHQSSSRSPATTSRENQRSSMTLDHPSGLSLNAMSVSQHRNSEQLQGQFGPPPQYPGSDSPGYNHSMSQQNQQRVHPQQSHGHLSHTNQQLQPYSVSAPMHHHCLQHNGGPTDAEHIVHDYRLTANEQLPVWISDQTLGGNTFLQNGMDAFLLPTDYLPPAPQIW